MIIRRAVLARSQKGTARLKELKTRQRQIKEQKLAPDLLAPAVQVADMKIGILPTESDLSFHPSIVTKVPDLDRRNI